MIMVSLVLYCIQKVLAFSRKGKILFTVLKVLFNLSKGVFVQFIKKKRGIVNQVPGRVKIL